MDPSAPRAADHDQVARHALRKLSIKGSDTWHDMTLMEVEEAEEPQRFPLPLRERPRRYAPSSPDSAGSPRMPPTPWTPDSDRRGFTSPRFEQKEPTLQRYPSNETSPIARRRPNSSKARQSGASSQFSGYSLYPAPTKPLPALPPSTKTSQRISSSDSAERSSIATSRSSQISAIASNPDRVSTSSSEHRAAYLASLVTPEPREIKRTVSRPAPQPAISAVDVLFWKLLVSDDKKKSNTVHYLDISATSSTLAGKYGNNIIKFWSMAGGTVQSTLKISSYTEAQSRSRDYLIRSHAILCESSALVAIASRFGRCIEIWNWNKKKCLQSVDDADRWTAGREDCYDNGWSPLAVYHGAVSKIDLYSATRDKKPLVKAGTIDLNRAGLPFIPQYPELALSATSPLLVLAAGPRPPRPGHPPPDRETLLVAWEAHGDGNVSNTPYRVARPWQHTELETAIPCDLATYGSAVVSIWIPATYRAVAAARGTEGYTLSHVPVTERHVLVWDLTANSTKTFSIPNTTCCISPDCRFVAYCHASKTDIGARGSLVILDVMTGRVVWSYPDGSALAIDSGPKPDFKQFDDLSRITELAFSADGKFLVIGDDVGRTGIYQVQEARSK